MSRSSVMPKSRDQWFGRVGFIPANIDLGSIWKFFYEVGQNGGATFTLFYVLGLKKRHDALMGWVGSGDMKQQLRLRFETKEHAIAYAERKDIPYRVEDPEARHVVPKSYADNFRWDRVS